MNVESLEISENLQEAVRSVSKTEWIKFFSSWRNQELASILGEEKDLTNIRARAMLIGELEHLFVSELKAK